MMRDAVDLRDMLFDYTLLQFSGNQMNLKICPEMRMPKIINEGTFLNGIHHPRPTMFIFVLFF